MKIHEYQAARLMREYGIPAENGTVAETVDGVRSIAKLLGEPCVLKAQIHSGGRGKAGGVRRAANPDEAAALAQSMLNSRLVTRQTGPEGKLVRKLFVTRQESIRQEYYLSVTLDSDSAGPVLMASRSGGMEIEAIAASNPEEIVRVPIAPELGYRPYMGRETARRIGLPRALWDPFIDLAGNLVRLFLEKDCSLVEINPLVETEDGRLLALDAKITFDDNALFRHPDCAGLRDPLEEDPRESKAARHGLNYIPLSGDIGCLVNGAGLAMATMDIILKFGGQPANFLDVGGSADKARVQTAFELLLSDAGVHAIFVNIFGGIVQCNVIAEGLVAVARQLEIKVPLVVRLEGTNAELGKQILQESGLNLIAVPDLAQGAREAVARARQYAEEAGA